MNAKPNALLDVAFGLILALLLLGGLQDGFKTGPIEKGPAAVWLGVYLQAWGLSFIASYFWPRASYLLKGLMWISENWSRPRGRWTAILWGVFAIGMGTMAFLQGLGFTHL